jgi:protein-S-isoprenylcysteine O-methyltransferase Ste14
MSELSRKALRGFVGLEVILLVMLFLPSWSFRFWQAWIHWLVISLSSLFITLYFLKRDPHLVEGRLNVGPAAEPERRQQILQALAALLFIALFTIPGFDHRLHWSVVPVPVVLLADVIALVGYAIIFFVFKENTYAASIVRVEAGQRVIDTGPYRLVRHPMYAAGALIFFATPLALGSLWALLVAVLLSGVVVARLIDEERLLSAKLPGYDAYRRKVRFRLVPKVW